MELMFYSLPEEEEVGSCKSSISSRRDLILFLTFFRIVCSSVLLITAGPN